MSRMICAGMLATSLLIVNSVQASDPVVTGRVSGRELAQQTLDHPAFFVGAFSGQVGGRPAIGAWAVSVIHEVPLPSEVGQSINIIGGQWVQEILVLQGFRLRRVMLSGNISGTLTYVGSDRFLINATMNVASGGSGDIVLNAILDHNVFPPAVAGTLRQPVIVPTVLSN